MRFFRALAEGRLGPLDKFDILDTQLCALGEEKSDSCSGDSGGPIFAEVQCLPFYAIILL